MSNQINNVKKSHLNIREELHDMIDLVTTQEINNRELQRYLNDFFAKKGLSQNTVTCLFSGIKNPSDLDKIDQIAFIQGAYDMLKWENLKPEKYFGVAELSEFDTLILVDQKINKILMKNSKKINDYTYQCYATAKELYLYRKNSLVTYNKETQRAPKYKVIGTNNLVVKEASVNYEAVKEMEEKILSEKFFTNEIYFNVLIIPGKEPKFTFQSKFENIGDLVIEPCYDRASDRLTYCNIIDGYHRFLAMTNAYIRHKEKYQKDLETGLTVMVTLLTEQQAKDFMVQQFQRSDTDEDYLRALEGNDYNIFAKELATKIDVLDNDLPLTYTEMKVRNELTYLSLLGDAIKLTSIKVNQFSVKKFTTEKMALIINSLLEILIMTKGYKNIDDMKKESYFLDTNMFIGYIAIANILKDYEFENYIIPIADALIKQDKTEIKKLKLNNKNCNLKKVYNYFESIAKEVVNSND